MTTMLVKAATEVAKKFAIDWGNASDEQRESSQDIVRAVLMAIREPSSEMMEAGLEQWSNLQDMYEAMIDAVLNEKPE